MSAGVRTRLCEGRPRCLAGTLARGTVPERTGLPLSVLEERREDGDRLVGGQALARPPGGPLEGEVPLERVRPARGPA